MQYGEPRYHDGETVDQDSIRTGRIRLLPAHLAGGGGSSHRTVGVTSPLQSVATLDARHGLDDLPREVGSDRSPGMRGAGHLRATRSVVPASRRGRRRAGPPGSLPRSRTATDRPCFDGCSLRRVLRSPGANTLQVAHVVQIQGAARVTLHGNQIVDRRNANPDTVQVDDVGPVPEGIEVDRVSGERIDGSHRILQIDHRKHHHSLVRDPRLPNRGIGKIGCLHRRARAQAEPGEGVHNPASRIGSEIDDQIDVRGQTRRARRSDPAASLTRPPRSPRAAAPDRPRTAWPAFPPAPIRPARACSIRPRRTRQAAARGWRGSWCTRG